MNLYPTPQFIYPPQDQQKKEKEEELLQQQQQQQELQELLQQRQQQQRPQVAPLDLKQIRLDSQPTSSRLELVPVHHQKIGPGVVQVCIRVL